MTERMTTEEAILTLQEAVDEDFGAGIEIISKDGEEAVVMAIEALEEKEEKRWIPVSERLPEKADSYLVTYLDESGVYAGLVEFVECAYWTGLRWQKDCDDLEDVTAWMELPKPYKEVGE